MKRTSARFKYAQKVAKRNEETYRADALDEILKAEIVNTSKLAPSVIIKTHYWINHR